MEIFVDTADITEITKRLRRGVIDGVTTNPSIMLKDGVHDMEKTAREVADRIDDDADVVLLGSVASGKYVDILWPIFGERLVFPSIFAGLGDMSRGGLLLRAARANRELEYSPLTAPRQTNAGGDPVELARAWARSHSYPMGPKRG